MRKADQYVRLLEALDALEAAVREASTREHEASPGKAQSRKLLARVWSARQALGDLGEKLDPIRPPNYVLDPTDPKTTGMLIGRLLEEVEPVRFEGLGMFYGSGVYALYYCGAFPAYRAIRGTSVPIYVGKADPSNPKAKTPKEQGPRICARLNEHVKTIRSVENLCLGDLSCRYLVIQSGWQKAAEDYLIHAYKPVWNNEIAVCSGIGKHGDTARRERSDWDVLHPGRSWADAQVSRSGQTADRITRAIEFHFLGLCKAEPDRWPKLLNQDWVKERFKA